MMTLHNTLSQCGIYIVDCALAYAVCIHVVLCTAHVHACGVSCIIDVHNKLIFWHSVHMCTLHQPCLDCYAVAYLHVLKSCLWLSSVFMEPCVLFKCLYYYIICMIVQSHILTIIMDATYYIEHVAIFRMDQMTKRCPQLLKSSTEAEYFAGHTVQQRLF